jgi:hypothetical protein
LDYADVLATALFVTTQVLLALAMARDGKEERAVVPNKEDVRALRRFLEVHEVVSAGHPELNILRSELQKLEGTL